MKVERRVVQQHGIGLDGFHDVAFVKLRAFGDAKVFVNAAQIDLRLAVGIYDAAQEAIVQIWRCRSRGRRRCNVDDNSWRRRWRLGANEGVCSGRFELRLRQINW
ncbi:MAG TPA: hypothetical protein VGM81_09045 [Burkholderiaceae bacterium]